MCCLPSVMIWHSILELALLHEQYLYITPTSITSTTEYSGLKEGEHNFTNGGSLMDEVLCWLCVSLVEPCTCGKASLIVEVTLSCKTIRFIGKIYVSSSGLDNSSIGEPLSKETTTWPFSTLRG